MNTRKQQAIAARDILFKTAVQLFNEKGYDNVTVAEIASAAGFAKGNFYTYFRSKSDIVIEEFRDIDAYYKRYHRNLARHVTGTDKLLAFTRAQMRYVRDTVGIKLLKLLYINNLAVPDTEKILINTQRYLQVIVEEVISFGQERGEFRQDISSHALARDWNRALRSVFLDWGISNAEWDLVEEGVRFASVVLIPALCHEPAVQTGPTKNTTRNNRKIH